MADRLEAFTVLALTGTTPAAPQVDQLRFAPGVVRRLEITVPDGPRGLCGFALGQAGQPTFPEQVGAYVYANADTITLDDPNSLNTGSWQIFTVNAGGYAHRFFLRFHVDEIGHGAGQPFSSSLATPLPAASISGAG